MRPPFELKATGINLRVRVIPNSSLNCVEKVELRDNGVSLLRVRLHAVPEKGKANRALIALLAKKLAIPKSRFEIIGGHKSRLKTLSIEGDPQKLATALEALLSL